jgi:hypothetical protein
VTRQAGRAIFQIVMCKKIPLQYKNNLNLYASNVIFIYKWVKGKVAPAHAVKSIGGLEV